jgi:hypothetical protein
MQNIIPYNTKSELKLYEKYFGNNNLIINVNSINIQLNRNNKRNQFTLELINNISELLKNNGIQEIKIDLEDFINFNNSMDFMFKNLYNYELMQEHFFDYIFKLMNLNKIFGKKLQILFSQLKNLEIFNKSNRVQVIENGGSKIKKGGFNNKTLLSLCLINYMFILQTGFCEKNLHNNINQKRILNKNQTTNVQNIVNHISWLKINNLPKTGGFLPSILLHLFSQNSLIANIMAFEYFTGHTIKEIIKNLFKKMFLNKGMQFYHSISKYIFGEEFVKKNKSTKKKMKESKCPKCQCKCQCDYNNQNENENNQPNLMSEKSFSKGTGTGPQNNGVGVNNVELGENGKPIKKNSVENQYNENELMQQFSSFPSFW